MAVEPAPQDVGEPKEPELVDLSTLHAGFTFSLAAPSASRGSDDASASEDTEMSPASRTEEPDPPAVGTEPDERRSEDAADSDDPASDEAASDDSDDSDLDDSDLDDSDLDDSDLDDADLDDADLDDSHHVDVADGTDIEVSSDADDAVVSVSDVSTVDAGSDAATTITVGDGSSVETGGVVASEEPSSDEDDPDPPGSEPGLDADHDPNDLDLTAQTVSGGPQDHLPLAVEPDLHRVEVPEHRLLADTPEPNPLATRVGHVELTASDPETAIDGRVQLDPLVSPLSLVADAGEQDTGGLEELREAPELGFSDDLASVPHAAHDPIIEPLTEFDGG